MSSIRFCVSREACRDHPPAGYIGRVSSRRVVGSCKPSVGRAAYSQQLRVCRERGGSREEVSAMPEMCMQMMNMLRDMWNMMFPNMPM